MAKRSLRASTTGIEKAKQAFDRKGWTQEYLASEVGLETRQSVWKFFSGRPIERSIFIELCFQLDLDWQDIADFVPPTPDLLKTIPPETPPLEIEVFVEQVRSHLSPVIENQCGTLRLLDISQPLALDDIYVQVKILAELTRQRWLDVSDLQDQNLNSFDRLSFTQLNQKSISALEAVKTYNNLMVLGKPGAGKTTFLQSLALQCIRGDLPGQRLPFFIPFVRWLEDVAKSEDFSLFNYLLSKVNRLEISAEQLENLLKAGRVLLLLDGLDEVGEENSQQFLKQLQNFIEIYYQNQLIITCRIAAKPYQLPGFTDVEIADFDSEQIAAFAKKWFIAAAGADVQKGLEIADQFLEKLQQPENQPIRELAVTPILLALTCSVFQTKADFPNKRAKLYEAGLDILLVRWDEARGIQRDEIYRTLSLAQKIALLSQIAAIAFTQGTYFFEKTEIEHYITDYLASLPELSVDPESLRLKSAAILKAIETQHGLLVERARGIYSFSHLTFQEYFTARHLVATTSGETVPDSLQQLATHVTEGRWREVFLLAASLLRNADPLLVLMKQQIDAFAANHQPLPQLLAQVSEKSRLLTVPYVAAAVRAFYLTLFWNRDLTLALALDVKLARDLAPDLALDLDLARAFDLVTNLVADPDLKQILGLGFALELGHALDAVPEFARSLQQLKAQLPDPSIGRAELIQWWQISGQTWAENFRALLIQFRHIGYDWHWSAEQDTWLQQYYRANQLLVDCLYSECRTTPAIRETIVLLLLLPSVEIHST